MYCTRKVSDDLTWIGSNDRRLERFEGVYAVPNGFAYNSYLLNDEKTVLFDTVDKAVRTQFLENLTHELHGNKLDYLIIHHMEPDHTAAIEDLLLRYPEMTIVCNKKTSEMMQQFFGLEKELNLHIVGENDTLETGRHSLRFIMAPMVHWPEVMFTYDSFSQTLFSADAFGCFGALNGALFADEVDYAKDYMPEARRYYANIVGKYGAQVQSVLKKLSAIQVEMICPLHGFVWRKDIDEILSKYQLWSRYEPEEAGVMIAYASVYGHTENAAEILSCRLRDRGIKTVMFDASVAQSSEMISAAFRWSHLVFASASYNAGIFTPMDDLINELVAHNIQNRTVAIIENGSWAPSAGKLIHSRLSECKKLNIYEPIITIKSALSTEQLSEIDSLADWLADSLTC